MIVFTTNNPRLTELIAFHYTESALWYLLFVLYPIAFGLLIASHLILNQINKSIKVVCYSVFLLQILFHLCFFIVSKNHFGYALIRPRLFPEIHDVYKINSCTKVRIGPPKNILKPEYWESDKNSKWLDNLYGRKYPQYAEDRIFMFFENHEQEYSGFLYDYKNVYKDSIKKMNDSQLKELTSIIYKSNILEKDDASNSVRGLDGFIVGFNIHKQGDFAYAFLTGNHSGDNRYAHYEFLFSQDKNKLTLLRSQKFATSDSKLPEYTYSIQLFSALLGIIALIAALIIVGIGFIKREPWE